MRVELEPIENATAEFRQLLEDLDLALSGPYSDDQHHALALDDLFAAHVTMFLARLAGAAVGCGGVALYDGFAEVKRMYTAPQARGLGVAQKLLARIEDCARAAGAPVLRLETGIYQEQAMALYERCGFTRCGPFGPYLEKPPHTIELSAFYEKPLESTGRNNA